MKAVILAAGKGTRMLPLTETTPKPLLRVKGLPLLSYIFDSVKKHVDEIIVIVGYKGQQIVDYYGDNYFGVPLTFIEQKEQLGTGHALLQAKQFVDGEFVFLLGDDYVEPELVEKVVKHDLAVVGMEVEDPTKFGVYETRDNKIIGLEEKPENPKSNLVNIGVWKMNSKLMNILPSIEKSPRGEYELTDGLKELIKSETVTCEKADHGWIPVGYPEDLEKLKRYLEKKMGNEEQLDRTEFFDDMSACPEPEVFENIQYPWEAIVKERRSPENKRQGDIHETAVLKGNVDVGEGTIIHPYVVIEGPVRIGKNCEIRSFSLIRKGTVVGNDCVIGHASEVKNTIMFNGAKIASHAFVGDSILGKGARVGSGVILANRRFDQKDARIKINGNVIDTKNDKCGAIIGEYTRIGANAATTPGTVVGKQTWVYGGSMLSGYIPKQKMIKLRQTVEITDKEDVILSQKDKSGNV